MINAVIIDDEHYAAQALVMLIKKNCPDVTITAVCNNAKEAVKVIRELQPQLVFLDIEMPYLNGFELLEILAPVSFECIFTTSYDQYAIKAIRFSALDYLLKPVDAEDLKAAVNRVTGKRSPSLEKQMELLLSRFQQPQSAVNRIALPTLDGLQIIPVDTILYCSSSSNYTIFNLVEDQKLIISRTLKEIEEMLEEYRFLRVHHSYLVNLNEVRKYNRGEGGSLLMSNGATIDVSRSRKEMLLKKLQPGK
ncbi:response regulator [Chitinophaga sp. SYP-B3965]|uniref:LytR/AlgR family response regulator transcription factor n=1 Tax=Chitinophaga sp. SYP-B3965 TaxID=2663120 RepID=UPI00129976BC|nr:response regulator [Chitinophaga sp. SYP-B3965]MRG48425.1 response regulator [Chitinophaga sp. SYP-B3965]